jgi:hypothetical protein
MAVTYKQNKTHIYKYKITHRDKWLEINRKYAKRKYNWKKVSREFLNILL